MVDLALRAQFHRARSLWLGLALTRDLAWSLALLLASALLAFHLDCRFVLSPPTRLLWDIGTLTAVGLMALVRAWGTVRRQPDDRMVATRVERRFPQLRERLLSAVELGRLPAAERERYSAGLLAAVQAEAETAAFGLDFRRAVTWGEALPAMATCAALAVAALLNAAVVPAAVAAWWGRMLFPGADIPVYRHTRVRIAPREALLLRGGDLPITITTDGQAVDHAVLHFRVGGGTWAQVALRPPFRHRLQGVAETAEFYATAGDGQSDPGVGRVVDAPVVVGLRLHYQFPAYMTRPEETVSGVSGTLAVPVGTRVELALTASKPLQTAVMEGGPKPVPLAVDGVTAMGHAALWADTTLRLRLRDSDGFMDRTSRGVEFHAVPDAAPVVHLEQPAGDMEVVADAAVPLRVTATDDHGLNRMGLDYAVSQAGSPVDRSTVSHPPLTLPLATGNRRERSLEARTRWNLGSLSLHPGDIVRYHAEADDFDNLRGPHVGRSAEQRLRVIERAEMERRLADGWQEWDQQLGQVQQEQAAARAALQAARTPSALTEVERRQRELAPRADELARRAAELAEMARTNRLAAEATLARQERASAELGELSSRAMPEAADRIRESAARPEQRAEAAARQAEISRRLEALRRAARPDADLEALARRAEELARAQAELEGQSQRLLPATLGLAAGELTLAQRGALGGMAGAQSSLRAATGQFEGALGRAARAAQEPAVAAARWMRERAVPERQGQAAEQVAGNLLARAAAGQQALAADLRQIAALLRQPREAASPAAAARQAMARVGQQLQRLLQQHAAVMQRTAARPSPAESRQLARQERALREQAARLREQLRRAGAPSAPLQGAARQMARAERQLQQGASGEARAPQQQAQDAMQEMARQLQDARGDRQAGAEQARLQQQLGELAQRQEAIGKALEPKEGMPDERSAARLAPRQEAVSRSARSVEQRLPTETFRSAMGQAREAMRRVGDALRRGRVGTPARSASRQAQRLLQQMARALQEQGAASPSQGGQPGGGQPRGTKNSQELARRLADMRLLRALEQGLREETAEAEGQSEGRAGRLRDLEGRQARTRRMTGRAGEALRQFPEVGRRVGEAAGAMAEAQRGLQGGSAGAETQSAQGTAVMRLTQAIGQGQQQLQAMARPGGGQPGSQSGPRSGRQGRQPALDSIAVRSSDEGGPRSLVPAGRRGFGLLSPGDQQALRQGGREKVPADYADLVRRYYRALSERGR